MPGLIAIIDSNGVAPGTINRMVQPLLHQSSYRLDRLESEKSSFARIHLGIFNPEPQPAFDESGDISIFFDGRLYGNDRVAKRLGMDVKKGDLLDPFFCMQLYKERGEQFVKELNGNFILCLQDRKEEKILIANDRFGFRVHFFAEIGNTLLLAPEPKAILSYPFFKKELDEEGVAQFFSLGEFWGETTLYQGIRMLPPSSLSIYQNGHLTIHNYWRLEYRPDYQSSEVNFIDQLVCQLKNSTSIRMADDRRYGVTLSGGLDSRSVVASIPTQLRDRVKAFTFGKPDSQEARVASRVANTAGLMEHIVLDSSPESIIENVRFDAWLNEGRLYMGLAFVHPIFQKIQQEADVIFDGFAMDLTLGGSYLSQEKLDCRSKEQIKKILAKKRRFDDEQLRLLLAPEFYQRVKDVPSRSFEKLFDRIISKEPGNISDEFAMMGHVAWMHIGDLAVRSRVEVSHPTSDNDFFDILLRIPPELRFNHRIYRKFLKQLSPELAKIPYNYTMVRADAPLFLWKWGVKWNNLKEFVKRRVQIHTRNRIAPISKRSYVAYNEWFRTRKDWRDYFEGVLFDDNPLIDKYLNRDYVRRLFDEQVRGVRDNSTKLLYIATFILFLKTHFWEGHG